MKNTEYFLGLDMGTSSVGWAVTDNKYQLMRRKGKDLWGIREFEPAEPAAERRSHRISRRRRQREVVRIGHIKEYFADAICKVDPYFYQRMENSKYYLEDKDVEVRVRNGIFDDENYQDADYYKDYPTIFHLRKELLENKSAPYDVRLVYLAVLNLFKRRGHFLNSSLNIDETEYEKDISKSYARLIELLANAFESAEDEEKIFLPESVSEEILLQIQEYLSSREYSRKRKAELIIELLGIDKKKKKEQEIIKGFAGLAMDCKKIFPLDKEEKVSAKFSDFSYSDNEAGILEALGDTYGEVLLAIKEIYDIGTLHEILKGKTFLSIARVEDYEQHKKDLERLKRVVKKYDKLYQKNEYDFFFRDFKEGSYSAYVNATNSDDNKNVKKRHFGTKGRTRDDFYKNVKRIIEKMPEDDEDVTYIKNAIEAENFMPKQLTASNGVIPNQVHAMELKKILENASSYLDFLNEVDGSGLSVKERIVRLYTYTIPYYIGPTSTDSHTGWIVRKDGFERGEILPWEYDMKIDEGKTHKEFITRMVRRCTYFSDEKVLPKNALKYEKYCVLNEINNIRIDNVRIDNELKQGLFNEVFKTGKKPSRKKIEQYLINQGVPKGAQITGIDEQINNSLSSYGKFKAIFGEEIERDSYKEIVEDIIFYCTVYGDAKKYLKTYLKETYPEEKYPMMTEKAINRIIGFRLKDWGRFSSDILDLQGRNKNTNEVYSLLTALWETNYNFMELLNSEEFTFKEELQKKEKKTISSLSEITPELLEEYYFSAPVKRMILQTMGVIKEIKSVMGCAPKRIFIEMTRHDDEKGDKGRKRSRKKQLLDLYKDVKDELHDKKYWSDLIELKDKSGELKSKKMYLYLKQMGRDMYTGKEIDLDELFTTKYDIDHIYPRHFVKDDSLENNLVLVNKSDNEHIKKDLYPIPSAIRNREEVQRLWERLHTEGWMNDIKFSRLKCREPFSDEQKAGFIARQLVETSQGTKGVADLLKLVLPETKIVYSKAGNVSEFRKKYKFPKSRLINEFHHAHDAYLNIVVGNIYYTKFTDQPLRFIKNDYKKDAKAFEYNLGRMYDWNVVRNGYCAWVAEGSKGKDTPTIETVRKTLRRNSPLYTRRSFEKAGVINKVTLYGHDKAKEDGYIPPKMKDEKMQDVTKYGGFTSITISYYFLVEYEKMGKKVRSIEGLPGYLQSAVEKEPSELEKYCSETLKLENFSVRVRKINIQAHLRVNGFDVHLSGKTNNQLKIRNAVNFFINEKAYQCICEMEKAKEKGELQYVQIDEEYAKKYPHIQETDVIEIYDEILEKTTVGIFSKRPNPIGSILIKGREKFLNLPLEKKCSVLLSSLEATKIGLSEADLSLVGGKEKSGVMLMPKNINSLEEVLLIHESVTGLYNSKPVDLKTV